MFLREKFNEYNEKYFNRRVRPDIELAWNTRIFNSAGRCHFKMGEPFKIDISTKYMEMFPHDFRNVLIHEMIHVLYPECNHDGDFEKEMNRLNSKYPELNISIHTNYNYYRYVYQCENCGQYYKRGRKLEKGLFCGTCRDRLVLVDTIESYNDYLTWSNVENIEREVI